MSKKSKTTEANKENKKLLKKLATFEICTQKNHLIHPHFYSEIESIRWAEVDAQHMLPVIKFVPENHTKKQVLHW